MDFHINDDLRRFIRKELNLIEENNFEELYNRSYLCDCSEENPDGIAPELTNIFLECGIDPLLYMKEIPYGYYCNNEIKEFAIPDNIERITFGTLNLHKCENFILPKNLNYLHLGIFDYIGCDSTLTIIYKRFKREIENHIIDTNSKSHSTFYFRKSKFIIKCHDGVLEYGPDPYKEYYWELPF